MKPCSICSRAASGASLKPCAASASSSWRSPSSWSSGTAPEASWASIAAGTCRSEAARAKKPVGSSGTSTDGTNVSQTCLSVSRWISDSVTVGAVAMLDTLS